MKWESANSSEALCASALSRKSTMADAAIPATSDSTEQKQFRIAKLKLPTLATKNIQRHGHSLPIHFHLRSEAENAPPLLAALFSNKIFRAGHGSSDAQHISIRLRQPGSIPNNPLNMFTEMFSEIKQELATEARKFSLTQTEYLKECIKRSGSPAIYRTMKTPETANSAVSWFKNDLGFLVRLFFEIMQGPEDNKFKAACEIPSLPDIYSNKESKVACDMLMPSLPDSSVVMKQITGAPSYKNSPTSGFNSLFTNKRK